MEKLTLDDMRSLRDQLEAAKPKCQNHEARFFGIDEHGVVWVGCESCTFRAAMSQSVAKRNGWIPETILRPKS